MLNILDKNVLLDNNNIYKIVYSINIKDRPMYYLININDFSDVKFCYMENDSVFEEVRNKNELTEIIESFCEQAAIFMK